MCPKNSDKIFQTYSWKLVLIPVSTDLRCVKVAIQKWNLSFNAQLNVFYTVIKYFAHTNMAKNVALILIAAHSAVQKGNRNPKQKRNIGKEYDNSVPELLFV